MNSTAVNKALRQDVRPVLKANGFTAFTARTAWRYVPGRIEIVNLQSFNSHLANAIDCTSYSFALNLSIYLPCVSSGMSIGEKDGELRPEEFHGHLRFHAQRTLVQPELSRRDVWYIDPQGAYLPAAVADVCKVLAETGLPWFAQWPDDARLLAALQQAGALLEDGTVLPGGGDSPHRNLVAGYVARNAGQSQLARQYLSRALEQYEAIDRQAAALKKRRPFTAMTPPSLKSDLQELS